MSSYVPYKTKQFFFVLIKLSIVVGAFYFIYSKITKNESLEFSTFLSFLNENNVFSTKNISILILLSFFNWFFEILKWQHLVGTLKHISFISALEQSLGGLTASLITPNRIGDYGAKAIYFTKKLRTKIVLLNLLGNMAQMTVTTLFGLVGLFFFLNAYSIDINFYKVTRFASIILIIGLLVLFGVKQKRFKIKGVSFTAILTFIKSISIKTHSLNLALSFIRYLIFSFQFYYLLIAFGVDISYANAMMAITSMYVLASIVPTISIFDVVVKGSIAVFLFDYLHISELTILSITTTMWLLNFVIPSIIGSYFVLNFKLTNLIE
ncbi:lysylphosphatidylglycerol synthase-like protein [Winogradskyella eximia]|uniref:Lysylphosphatidylglycerol synthase-like protein n=1 Tax=Winogradskyella eximia TaxID=262006 RepID=A0A3D9HB51_9FLAO|nr:lysylphosphatidylglycerol synthase domain-containing protein [Winogradskyella eximia]RED46717.1 lysylphosphatidylglycerol synthase-like protein [Winogradskyella eximia]